MIKLDNVSVTYPTQAGDHDALSGIDLSLEGGSSCVIIGPTGCGKTSLLYLLAGLIKPGSGQVKITGKPLTSIRLSTSLILQQHGLFPWKNAFENASLGLTIRRVKKPERSAAVRSLMEDMGIWDIRNSYPGQLSGGQRQRVAIARSLATQPDLLLMDEPFSALDSMTRETLQNLVLGLWRKQSFTFVLVTHSIEEAVFLGNRIIILSHRPGRLITILDNPGMGDESFRQTEAFHSRCTEIRQILKGLS